MKFPLLLPVLAFAWTSFAVPSWPEPTREMKPWVYNWWMGSAVDEKGLEYQSAELQNKGFGGFHVIPIYGAKGYEKQWRSYLSPEWMAAFADARRIGAAHGLGVDLTMGSGWCFGGPWLAKEQGVWKLVVDPQTGELTPKRTGQKVKRGGVGGVGPMMNPYSVDAMKSFLKAFEVFDRPGAALPEHFYHDSWEYFQADWCPELAAAFKAKRGYDLTEKWDLLAGKGDREAIARLKCDYRETLSDLVVEDVFPLWVEWCHRRGVPVRNEGHGTTANWLDFYALADVPETEMFGKTDRDILVSKFASSAAHVMGRPLVGAESCTWIDEHFHETLAEVKVFIDRLFLSGVNHVFYHGLCYSPVEAAWPGWCFYASLEMNPRNPVWRDVGTLNAYITRCQSIFQTCTPDNDVLVHWPLRDYWWNADGFSLQMSIHNRDGWFYGQEIGTVARRLYEAGYAFDFVSDRQLQNADLALERKYGTLAMPAAEHTPTATRAATARFKTVVDLPKGGVDELPSARREPFPAKGLLYTRFRKGADTVYFLVNPSEGKIAASFAPSCRPGSAWLMDPLTGAVSPLAVAGGGLALSLEAGHSCILWCSPEKAAASAMAPGAAAILDLGEVIGNESVRVTVNGTYAGTLIMPPYRLAVPSVLLKGPRLEDNAIVCDVAERGANRIRQLDIDKVEWKYFTDINMVTIDYRKFDASGWPIQEHGVKGPIRLIPQP